MDLTPERIVELFRRHPVAPFRAVPYDAVRGISWMIVDASDDHVATVFEEEAARLIVTRLNVHDAIREAENDALERAALAVDDAFHGDYHGKPIVERIRAMKHKR